MSDDEVSTPSVIRKGDGSPVRSALKGNRKTPRPKDGVKFGVVDVKVRQVSRFFEKNVFFSNLRVSLTELRIQHTFHHL